MQIETKLVVNEKNVLVKKSKEQDEQIRNKNIQIKTKEKSIKDLEQYTRRNSVKMYGLYDKDKNESF